MYFRSKFLEISKPVHFWNREIMGDQKINVGICADTDKAVILDFQNGRHKIQFLRYLCFCLRSNKIQTPLATVHCRHARTVDKTSRLRRANRLLIETTQRTPSGECDCIMFSRKKQQKLVGIATSLEGSENYFYYSHSSTNPENLAKIGHVDFEIISLPG